MAAVWEPPRRGAVRPLAFRRLFPGATARGNAVLDKLSTYQRSFMHGHFLQEDDLLEYARLLVIWAEAVATQITVTTKEAPLVFAYVPKRLAVSCVWSEPVVVALTLMQRVLASSVGPAMTQQGWALATKDQLVLRARYYSGVIAVARYALERAFPAWSDFDPEKMQFEVAYFRQLFAATRALALWNAGWWRWREALAVVGLTGWEKFPLTDAQKCEEAATLFVTAYELLRTAVPAKLTLQWYPCKAISKEWITTLHNPVPGERLRDREVPGTIYPERVGTAPRPWVQELGALRFVAAARLARARGQVPPAIALLRVACANGYVAPELAFAEESRRHNVFSGGLPAALTDEVTGLTVDLNKIAKGVLVVEEQSEQAWTFDWERPEDVKKVVTTYFPWTTTETP